MKRSRLSIDTPGDGSTLEAFSADGPMIMEHTTPAPSECERLFEVVKKVNFTNRLLGREKSDDTAEQAIFGEDHFKDAKHKIELTIQEVQRLNEVIQLLHPKHTVDGPTLSKFSVERAELPYNAVQKMKGTTVLAKRRQLQSIAHRLRLGAESVEAEARLSASRISQLLNLRRQFQLRGNGPNHSLLVQTSCPPAAFSQVVLLPGAQFNCPQLQAAGIDNCISALHQEVASCFERGLFAVLSHEAQQPDPSGFIVLEQQEDQLLRLDAAAAGLVTIELTDDGVKLSCDQNRHAAAEQNLRRLYSQMQAANQRHSSGSRSPPRILQTVVAELQHQCCRERAMRLLDEFAVQHSLRPPRWHHTSCRTTCIVELRDSSIRLHGTLSGSSLTITNAFKPEADSQRLTLEELPYLLRRLAPTNSDAN